ncbi:hypothetical protein ABZT08_23570 [Streptomyces sp. NPDC005526]|uniref:hypothetical protein n=1 Tax=Streptomyces sp. NPDC005526 TaxID=3156885 RepID=UPI00339E6759
MLALRLTRAARPAVQLRRLTVAAASAGTGFLLLCTLGYALGRPEHSAAAALRLSWCAVPLAATVHLAVAVARTDPGTRPRPGLSALGLGPGRLMAVSAVTTALSCTLGSLLALLAFALLRGDLTTLPFHGAVQEFLAAHQPLPVPAVLTLLMLVPALASVAAALVLRPRERGRAAGARGAARGFGRFGAYGRTGARETFGAYGRFGSRLRGGTGASGAATSADPAAPSAPSTDGRTGKAARVVAAVGAPAAEGRATGLPNAAEGSPAADGSPAAADDRACALADAEHDDPDPHRPPAPRRPPAGLPWGIAVLAAGLAVEAYANRFVTLSGPARPGDGPAASGPTLPGGLVAGTAPTLVGWLLTALGLALAGPGLTHLIGRLLQAVRPGAVRLLAGRVLMEEAGRIGRPLGVVCAVASGTYAMIVLYREGAPAFGPLTLLGTLLVTGCSVATLLIAAVEARQARAGTTAALLRLGAPATTLRAAAALRAAALLGLFGPLTLAVADLAALPLAP